MSGEAERPDSRSGGPVRSAREPERALHVLHVVPAALFRRFGPFFRQLGFALGAEGLRVSLLTDDLQASLAFDGTPIVDFYLPALSGWRAWRAPRELDAQFPRTPDVVHVWSAAPYPLVGRWAADRGAPVLLHLTGPDDVPRAVRIQPAPSRVLCLYRRLERLWADAGGRGETVYAPPALLSPRSVPPLLPAERTVGLVWAGFADDRAGLPVMLDAITRLRQQQADLQAVLVCLAGRTQPIWQRVRSFKIQDVVSLIDASDAWVNAIGGCDILIVPGPEREVTLAPLVAMAHERIVLASADQPADWFIDEQTCLMFPPDDGAALAGLLRRAIDRFPSVRAVARAAARHVEREHAITTAAADLYATYLDAIAERGGAAGTVNRP